MQKKKESSPQGSLSQTTKGLLQKFNFPPKKKLGQNFIIDEAAVERIVLAAELIKEDVVLEIGTGLGTLTKALAQNAGKVISVEYDKLLFEIAKEVLVKVDNLTLIRDDFLKIDLKKTLGKDRTYKIVSNLPYYITTPIITKLIEAEPKPSLAVLTVQKEVGERLVADAGSKAYGSLSIYAQYYFEVKVASHIPESAFYPHPAVSSSIVVLRPRKTPPADVKDEKLFFNIVRAAFEHRRKTLRNAILISHKFDISKEALDAALLKAGIDGGRRGETLGIKEFADLSKALV
jgi:16S rRNA (adenine1518-N6/adenine1519-N6)-dimethyltransferase